MSGLWMLPVAALGLAPGANAQFDRLLKAEVSVDTLMGAARELWAIIGPGGRLHPAYFLEHKGHLIIEGLLVVVILFLFLQRAFKPTRRAKEEAPLSDKVGRASGAGPLVGALSQRGQGRGAIPWWMFGQGHGGGPGVGAARLAEASGTAYLRQQRSHFLGPPARRAVGLP